MNDPLAAALIKANHQNGFWERKFVYAGFDSRIE